MDFGEGSSYLALDDRQHQNRQSDLADWIAYRINDGFLARLAGILLTIEVWTAPVPKRLDPTQS